MTETIKKEKRKRNHTSNIFSEAGSQTHPQASHLSSINVNYTIKGANDKPSNSCYKL